MLRLFGVFSVMPNFAEKVEMAVEALNSNPQKEIDENDFIEASRLVYDGVRDIRQAVLMSGVGSCQPFALRYQTEFKSHTGLLGFLWIKFV